MSKHPKKPKRPKRPKKRITLLGCVLFLVSFAAWGAPCDKPNSKACLIHQLSESHAEIQRLGRVLEGVNLVPTASEVVDFTPGRRSCARIDVFVVVTYDDERGVELVRAQP